MSSSKTKAFCAKVRQQVSEDEYLCLSKYLDGYSVGTITGTCLKDKVADLLKQYPEFILEFLNLFNVDSDGSEEVTSAETINKFKNYNKRTMIMFRLLGFTIEAPKPPDDPESSSASAFKIPDDPESSSVASAFKSPNDPESSSTASVLKSSEDAESSQRNKTTLDRTGSRILRFCEKVRKETSREEYKDLLKYLYCFGSGKITRVDVKMAVYKKFPNFVDEFLEVLDFYEGLNQLSSSSSSSSEPDQQTMMRNKGKRLKRTITQRDDELTPSYKFLPKNDSSADRSRCCEPGDPGPEVLNFCCYSEGSSGGEDSMKPKDPQQEKLNKLEDALSERDVLASWFRSAKINANKLHEAILKGEIKNANEEVVNKHLTPINFRFIKMMYGEQGSQVVEALRRSPEDVLPLIIQRLTQKEKENPGLGLAVGVCGIF